MLKLIQNFSQEISEINQDAEILNRKIDKLHEKIWKPFVEKIMNKYSKDFEIFHVKNCSYIEISVFKDRSVICYLTKNPDNFTYMYISDKKYDTRECPMQDQENILFIIDEMINKFLKNKTICVK